MNSCLDIQRKTSIDKIFTMESEGETVVSMMNEETLAWFLQTYGFFLA